MKIQQETLYGVFEEIEELIKLHYDEVALHKDFMKLDPDWPRYHALEQSEKLIMFTIRDEDKLIGYSAFFIDQHLHYKGSKIAINDVVFLHPDYRNISVGSALIKFCDEELSKMGETKITWHVKFSNDFRHILKALGYVDEEIVCGKIAGVKH